MHFFKIKNVEQNKKTLKT